jgi:hypothetical protein
MRMNGRITMKFKIFSTMVCVLLAACSDPKDYKLSTKTSASFSEASLQEKVKKLSNDEKQLFEDFMDRSLIAETFDKAIYKPGTIREAITEQQAWLERQAIENEELILIKREAVQKKIDALKIMHSTLSISLASLNLKEKNLTKGNNFDYYKIDLTVKNNSANDIAGFNGAILFKDVSGANAKMIQISTFTDIPAGQTIFLSTTSDKFTNDDKYFVTMDAEKNQYEWIPNTYIFKDGGIWQMPK